MIDAKTIKERIKKWEKMDAEFEKQKEIENEKEIEKEVKKYSKNKINLNPNICQYCKKNKAEKKYVNEETIKLTINSVGFVV
ncbi:hypothetical protein J5751_05270 [bacterium]|nr:hypothetical protein [bacterium]